MTIEEIRRLMDYNNTMNHKLWAIVDKLPKADFEKPHEYSMGGVKDQLFHMMQSEWMGNLWARDAVPSSDDPSYVGAEDYPTWEKIKAKWQETEAMILKWLDTLTDSQVNAPISLQISADEAIQCKLWDAIVLGVNHNTNHRAQVLRLLYDLGAETYEQGYYFYLVEKNTVPVAG